MYRRGPGGEIVGCKTWSMRFCKHCRKKEVKSQYARDYQPIEDSGGFKDWEREVFIKRVVTIETWK
jgi:hypothetical protein